MRENFHNLSAKVSFHTGQRSSQRQGIHFSWQESIEGSNNTEAPGCSFQRDFFTAGHGITSLLEKLIVVTPKAKLISSSAYKSKLGQ